MPKRFIDTDIFKKRSIRALQAPYKLLYIYLFTDCNNAGIWEVDLEVAGVKLGFEFDEPETIKMMGSAITVFDRGAKWYLNGFVEFQYGVLNEANRAHKSVIDQLSRYPEIMQNKPLTRPLQGCKDMDKDKDKDKVMDKDKDKEVVNIEIILPFQTENFNQLWTLWKDYKKKEHKFNYKTPQSEQAALKQLSELSGNDERKATEIVHQSMANGWKGFFDLKDQPKGKQKITFTAEDFK